MNIASHLSRVARVWPEGPAVAVGTQVVHTYAALGHRVSCLAAGMHDQLGLRPGDRVLLALKNCPAYLELMYACWHAGLVAVPANAKLHRDEFAYIAGNCEAAAAFTTPDLTETIAAACDDTVRAVVEIDTDRYTALLNAAPVSVANRRADDAAWLFYTSGTTGRPKGATLTHRNLNAAFLGYFADVDPGGPWRAFLHAAPMSHGSGLYGIANVVQGACHVIPDSGGFDANEVYALIEAWPGLSFFAAPTMVKRLLDVPQAHDTSNLKLIIYGGGPMYVEDCLKALERFGPKLSQLYGQGESPMTITALNAALHADRQHPRWMERLASVGVAQTPVEVRVVGADGSRLSPGDVGEVVVKGDTVMAGYWGNPRASADTIRDGWLHTGDMGSFDADGFLTLKDRSKDMIISGGTNIYPREIEETLLTHPDVAEVSVIGREDREWGEVVVAYVVANDRAVLGSDDLDAFCLEKMARFKRPKDYRFVAELPKNNYGKVLKTALRERDAGR
ncbi:MAG: AMP-binding protein [Pseudomonadota bacterium]